MRNVADLTDTWGSQIRVDVRPGTTTDDPELFVVTIVDERIAAVSLNQEQAAALRDALTDVLN